MRESFKILILTFFWGTFANGAPQTLERAMHLSLTEPGLSTLAEIIQNNFLHPVGPIKLPDIVSKTIGGAEIRLSNVDLSFNFRSLQLTTDQHSLRVSVGVQDLNVSVGELIVNQPVLRWHWRATCKDTALSIGAKAKVTADIGVTPLLIGDQIQLQPYHISVPIAPWNYRVDGPKSCDRGLYGLTAKTLVNLVLRNTRRQIEEIIRDQLSAFLPVIAEQLNLQTHLDMNMSVNRFPTLPRRFVALSARPTAVSVNDDGLQFEMGLTISPDLYFLNESKSSILPASFSTTQQLGSLRINPQILTAALATIWPDGGQFFNITAQARHLLTSDTLREIWAETTLSNFKDAEWAILLRLASPIDFQLDEGSEHIVAKVPKIAILLQAKQANDPNFKSIYQMEVEYESAITNSLVNNQLMLGFTNWNVRLASGGWAPGYQPKIPSVHEEPLFNFLRSLTESLHHESLSAKLDWPSLHIGSTTIELSRPYVTPPFVSVDLMPH